MPKERPEIVIPESTEELNALLERYATLRDSISGLEAEREHLAQVLRSALKSGRHAETDLYKARLQVTSRVKYDVQGFRTRYGDAATFEVASIDNKRVNALVKSGDLNPEHLADIREITEVHSLCLDTKSGPELPGDDVR